jgi:deoxyribonuclease V
LDNINQVAGVDASYLRGTLYAAVVVFDYPQMNPIEQTVAKAPLSFPYIPGLLSFREAPGILDAINQLSQLPDVFIVDGHGKAHPRRFGLASHLGVLLDLPTIGCAKSILIGESAPLGKEAGCTAQLTLDSELLGFALRTRTNSKPVYISIGHCMDLKSATEIMFACCKGYRLPEPSRQAHILAKSARAQAIDK